MSEIKIDKNVPVPSSGKYPWRAMEVGDSFFCQDQNVRIAASAASSRLAPKRFSARREGNGYRVWRVE